MGIDATDKIDGETERLWGDELHMDEAITQKISQLLPELGL